MDIDGKHKVLYALYTEYQKDIPDMNSVTFSVLDMEAIAFNIALEKLENEGFINGAIFSRAMGQKYPINVVMHRIMLTRFGVEYVEEKLKVERSGTGKEKVKWLVQKFGEFGWETLKAYTISKLTGM